MKTIEIVVSSTGTTTVQTKGFVGASCQDASRSIEQALGRAVAERSTVERYQNVSIDQANRTTN